MVERDLEPRYFEVSFKCSLRFYVTKIVDEILPGDYVMVECEKGYDVGIVSRPLVLGIDIDEFILLSLYSILNKVVDDRPAIEELLQNKIMAENDSLSLCRSYCHGRKVGSYLDVIATEFQYDRKKLTLYVTKSGEVSVCKLVRKLFDSFHTRICVEEIQSAEIVVHAVQRYLQLTQFNLNLSDVYFEPTRMPPVTDAPRNQRGNKKNQRSQNGYTQSGANSTLLSALHQYRPSYSVAPNAPNVPPPPHANAYTMGYTNPLPAGRSNMPSSIYQSQPPLQQQTRYEQRFNERVYHPQGPPPGHSQYRNYDQPTMGNYHPHTSLPPESYHGGSDYSSYSSQYSAEYYPPSHPVDDPLMYPPPLPPSHHLPGPPHPSIADPNAASNYPYPPDNSTAYPPAVPGSYNPYHSDLNYSTGIPNMPEIAPALPDVNFPQHEHHTTPMTTVIAPSITSTDESEYPHYVVHY